MPRRLTSGSLAGVLMVGLAVLGAVTFAARTIAPAVDHLRYGFPAYYTSSRLALSGAWTTDVYDNDWFSARVMDLTAGAIGETYRPNTPVMSLMATPIAGFDILTARRVWLAVDLVLLVVTVVVLLAALPALRAPPLAAAFVALCLWWWPLRETVSLGQAYALMLVLQALALWALLRGRESAAGVAVGLATAMKLASIPLFLVLVIRGSRRAVAVTVVVAIALAAATLPFAGLAGWTGFARAVVDDVVDPPTYLSLTAVQSATGFLAHLFVPDARWNPGAVAALPGLATAVAVAATTVALGVTVWLGRRGRLDVAAAAAITAGVLVLNVAQEYHFAVLLVPAAVALARWSETEDRSALETFWLVGALVLLAAPLPYEDPALTAGWMALLAYPRLYGAWLLWAWLIRGLLVERRTAAGVQVSAVGR